MGSSAYFLAIPTGLGFKDIMIHVALAVHITDDIDGHLCAVTSSYDCVHANNKMLVSRYWESENFKNTLVFFLGLIYCKVKE